MVSEKALALALLLFAVLAADAPTEAVTPSPVAPTASSNAFSPEKARFAIKVKDIVNPYRVLGVFVMPGEALRIETLDMKEPETSHLDARHGALTRLTATTWQWLAPSQPGHYSLTVTDGRTGDIITLNAFVKTPFDHQTAWLNGYHIGAYQQEPLRGNPIYNPPRGFVEVTPANQDVLVSPHFTLGQFLCKQEGNFPKYLTLREPLLLKLEMILEEVNTLGVAAPTLHVMSAFRTPQYNRSIGNRTVYSRHLYGDAADIFVDVDGDDRMDDLNGDGQTTTDDARVLAQIVDGHAEQHPHKPFTGGMGIYGPKSHRGPFVHVDVRGQRVRW